MSTSSFQVAAIRFILLNGKGPNYICICSLCVVLSSNKDVGRICVPFSLILSRQHVKITGL
jgi:hypothetical protein